MIPVDEVKTKEMQESKFNWEVKWFLLVARRVLKDELPSSISDGMVFKIQEKVQYGPTCMQIRYLAFMNPIIWVHLEI